MRSESVPSHEYFPQRSLFHGSVPRVMGTRLELIIVGKSAEDSLELWEKLCAEAFRLDLMLNRFDPGSELSELNSLSDAGEVFPSGEMLSLLRVCQSYRVATGGLFDVSYSGCGSSPVVRGNVVDLRGGRLDFGGFAKGWFSRYALSVLKEAGVEHAFLDFGGSSIVTVGTHPFGDCWKVEVPDPFSGRTLCTVDLRGSCLSVSGNRPAYDGHIVDPRSGRPVTGRLVCVCVSADPLDAEVGSTAAIVGGREKLDFLKNNLQLSEMHFFES